MRKGRKVISNSNLPMKLPLSFAVAVYLLFDKLSVPGWAWGVMFSIIGILCLIVIFDWFTNQSIDVFEVKDKK